jgi:pimeloyl-ACP methyl ester carboxylesterase
MNNIILLRGLVRESRHWGDFPQKLQKKLPDYKIHTPEIQGVGKYHDIISPNTLADMIDFMREQVKEFLGHDTIIIAISLGGMITKQWNEKYPDDFGKMILINTSFKGVNSLFHRLKPNAILSFLDIFLTSNTAMRERKILELVSNEPEKIESAHQNWIKIQEEAPVQKKSFVNQIKAALSFNPSDQKPKIPLLLIASRADRLCDYNCTLKLHQQWGGSLKLHQSAGHDIPLDAPDWLIDKILEFLEENEN